LAARKVRLAARIETEQRARWRELTRPFGGPELDTTSMALERFARAPGEAGGAGRARHNEKVSAAVEAR
jgi:hypothetical protein